MKLQASFNTLSSKTEIVCLSLLLVITVFAGCKKDSSDKATPVPASSTYFPVTSGSTWVYSNVITNGATSSNTISMTGKTALLTAKLITRRQSTQQQRELVLPITMLPIMTMRYGLQTALLV